MTPSAPIDETRSAERLQAAVGDAYEIRGLVGRGGFAEVFEAHDPALRRSVAVKVLRPDIAVSDAVAERFRREAQALARLRHPHVIEIYTVGQREGVAFYVMPLIAGESLAQRLEREGALEPAEAERIVLECASGLAAAHRAGIVHRDVKPENILLEGDERRVVLTDFGIARALEEDESRLTGTRMVVGSPRYLSPEQAAGDAIGAPADVYALGIVAWEMVTGAPPFEAPTAQALMVKQMTEAPPPLRSVASGCPSALAEVVDRCLAKSPAERWPDAGAVSEALRSAAAGGAREEDGTSVHGVAGGNAAERVERGDRLQPARARRDAFLALAVMVGAPAVELVLTGGATRTLPLVLLAGVFFAARVGMARRVARDAEAPPAADPFTGEERVPAFGEFTDVVRGSRSSRGHVLRLFHALSRVEQARFADLPEAVDAVNQAIRQNARRLAGLEERRRAAGGEERRGTPLPDRVVAGELTEARERVLSELHEQVEALEQIRHWLYRSGGADSDAVHDQLIAAVERAREAAAGRV